MTFPHTMVTRITPVQDLHIIGQSDRESRKHCVISPRVMTIPSTNKLGRYKKGKGQRCAGRAQNMTILRLTNRQTGEVAFQSNSHARTTRMT